MCGKQESRNDGENVAGMKRNFAKSVSQTRILQNRADLAQSVGDEELFTLRSLFWTNFAQSGRPINLHLMLDFPLLGGALLTYRLVASLYFPY